MAVLQLILHEADLPYVASKRICFLNDTKFSCIYRLVIEIIEYSYVSTSQYCSFSFFYLLKHSLLKKITSAFINNHAELPSLKPSFIFHFFSSN